MNQTEPKNGLADEQFMQPKYCTENKMNGYIAFYKGRKLEVRADSSYAAQQEAAKIFKTKKSYEITVILCEKDGIQITHSTASL